MRPGPLSAIACACALVLAGAASAGGAREATAPSAVEPAPPPAGFCRVPPAGAWPVFGDPALAPDLTPFQDYRAGLGIDGSARGEGVTIADIEYDWRASHADLVARTIPAAAGSGLPAEYRAQDHGTAVLGILGASEDGRGVTGLAPAAALAPVSPLSPSGYLPWATVKAAAQELGPGDVMLVELQAGIGPVGSAPFVPIEYYAPMRDEIRAAVAKGIVVVEPAGNSGMDLGTAGVPWLAGADDPLHSGALIVAGGGAGLDESGTADLRRVAGSNHGARIDLQGYGAGVVTAGYGDTPWSPAGDGAYTACFDGTSSAAATVAGAVAVLQGAEIARDGTPLTPAEVRDLLVATGTPQAQPLDGLIGPRPDVAAAIAALPDRDTLPPPPPVIVPDPPLPPAADPVPAAPPQPPVATPAEPSPAPPAVTEAGVRTVAALRGMSARIDRRARVLTLRLTGLAPRATVRVGGRRVTVARGGRVVLRAVRPGALIVRVTAPARPGVVHRASAFRVVVPARGAVRVVAVRP